MIRERDLMQAMLRRMGIVRGIGIVHLLKYSISQSILFHRRLFLAKCSFLQSALSSFTLSHSASILWTEFTF